MNKHITLATCCLLLISTRALADRPAMSEPTEIFEPEEVEISTSADHRPETVNEAATTENNTEVEAKPEKEPVIRVYDHRTDTQITGDTLKLQSDGTLSIQVPNFPRRGMSMEQVRKELGEPIEISPAVGSPPITRWTFSDRTVYFEYSNVVHVVADL